MRFLFSYKRYFDLSEKIGSNYQAESGPGLEHEWGFPSVLTEVLSQTSATSLELPVPCAVSSRPASCAPG